MPIKKISYDGMIWLVTTFLFFSLDALVMSFELFIQLGIAVLLLTIYVMKTGKVVLTMNKLNVYIIAFTLFCIISSFWAVNAHYATRYTPRFLLMIILVNVLYICYRDNENAVELLLKSTMWKGYLVLLFIVIRYGLSNIINMMHEETRIDNDVMNANIIGMTAGYSIVINFFYILKNKKLSVKDVMMIPSFLFIAISGSRKALILVIGGIIMLALEKNWDKRNSLKSIVKVVIALIIVILLFVVLLKMPFMDSINERMNDLFIMLKGEGNKHTSGYIRFQYNKLGMEIFKEHPILGIGIDNARVFATQFYSEGQYLHNNYIELLADSGIVGITLYYSIYMYILGCYLKYRKYQDETYYICLIIFGLFLFMNYGYVAYVNKTTYIFVFIFYMQARVLKKNRKSISKIKRSIKYRGVLC